jgi:hypothetical protein
MRTFLLSIFVAILAAGCAGRVSQTEVNEIRQRHELRRERNETVAKAKAGEALTFREWQLVLIFDEFNPSELRPMKTRHVLEFLGKPDRADPAGSWMEYDGKVLNSFTDKREALRLRFRADLVSGINDWN